MRYFFMSSGFNFFNKMSSFLLKSADSPSKLPFKFPDKTSNHGTWIHLP